jgi:hypothetical protein
VKPAFGVKKALVSDDVISYIEMCRRERTSLQQGMNFGLGGVFHVIDSWTERDAFRALCKFKLVAIEGDEDVEQPVHVNAERRRLIPTHVKLEVWKRDGAKCSICGAVDELHFDPVLPFAKGGTSMTAANVRLLCARHNLAKSDHIE